MDSEVPPPDVNVPAFNSLGVFRGSISLENKGSVARDHMANERTFLAWLRTSLSFITIGIGITQLFKLHNKSTVHVANASILLNVPESNNFQVYGKPLGGIFISLGIITLVYGFIRFFKVQHLLVYNYYPATRISLAALISAVLCVIVATLIIVVKTS